MGSHIQTADLRRHQRGHIFALLVMVLALAGCSSLGFKSGTDNRSSQPDFKIIAANLIHTVAQLPELTPSDTPVQMVKPASEFGRQVEQELIAQGYQLERVSGPSGVNQVVPQIKKLQTGEGPQTLYVLNVGRMSVERVYEVQGEQTVPVSEQTIRGYEERELSLNDELFELSDSEISVIAFKPYSGPQIGDMLAPASALKTARFWKKNNQNVVKKNMYETMVSNYKDVFAGFEEVSHDILVFPNDSLRIGEVNKHIIQQYVSKMNPDTDLMSVIGCSHGKTDISNGNSLLALGRANRVKEALLYEGVEHDQILDEGCWAPRTFDEVMPRRGVVLTLKRRKGS